MTLLIYFHITRSQGQVEKSALEVLKRLESPIEIIKSKDVHVFEYKRGLVPPPRPMQSFGLGNQFSLGRGRWTADNVSIFSVSDGKKLASTPPPTTTHYENLRMAKIQRAALETPTLAGYRLLPELTPGRAMMWGTILAMWGTGALVATTMRWLDIQGAEDAPAKLKATFKPVGETLKRWFAPLKGSMSVASARGTDFGESTAHSTLVRRLREKLAGV